MLQYFLKLPLVCINSSPTVSYAYCFQSFRHLFSQRNINGSTCVSDSLEHTKTLSLGSPSPLVAWSLSLYCSICISEWSAKGDEQYGLMLTVVLTLLWSTSLLKKPPKHFLLEDLLFETIIMSPMTLRQLLFTAKL